MNKLLIIDCGKTSRVSHNSKQGTKPFLSFTNTEHQTPQKKTMVKSCSTVWHKILTVDNFDKSVLGKIWRVKN